VLLFCYTNGSFETIGIAPYFNRLLKSFFSVINGSPLTVKKTAVSAAGGLFPIIVFTSDDTASCSSVTEAR